MHMNNVSKRCVQLFCILAAVLVLISACGNSKEKYDGISGEPGAYEYRVALAGNEVDDIFTLVGTPGFIYAHYFGSGVQDGVTSSGGANYCQVAEGGWIAYNGSEFIYMPHENDGERASLACGSLAYQTTDVMSLEAFSQLFSFAN